MVAQLRQAESSRHRSLAQEQAGESTRRRANFKLAGGYVLRMAGSRAGTPGKENVLKARELEPDMIVGKLSRIPRKLGSITQLQKALAVVNTL